LEEKKISQYLILLRIGKQQTDRRPSSVIAEVKEALSYCCQGEVILVFNSEDVYTVGLAFRSSYHPGGILAILRGTTYDSAELDFETGKVYIPKLRSAVLLNGDTAFIFELGEKFASFGFSKVQHWLEHFEGLPKQGDRS